MTDERTLRVSRGQHDGLNQALGWVLQAYDREFTTATMVKIEVEQVMVQDGDDWRYEWVASVAGTVEEAT